MLAEELKKILKGEVQSDDATLTTYSHDASLLEVRPEVVVYPKDARDIEALVQYVAAHKAENPSLSITARAAGTDMSGGAINDSIILDVTKHLNKIISVDDEKVITEPGVYYRDFEKATLARNRIMPSYTASKELCAIGGMVSNNSGGEKSIKYGKTEKYLRRQKMIFADGKTYDVQPLHGEALTRKMAQGDYEGNIYRNLFDLIDKNYDAVQAARPDVSKNSAGYYLWNVWDRKTGIFDLNKLLVGAQGTLGITVEAELGLVPVPKHSKMVVVFMKELSHLGDVVATIMKYEPESLESYDDYSMKLAIKFAGDFLKQLGFKAALKLGLQFIPDMFRVLIGGVPKLILLVEVTGDDEVLLFERAKNIEQALKPFRFQTHIAGSPAEIQKYWKIRRESFNLLRKHVKGMHTAPFIDDLVVKPQVLPEFLPKLKSILDEYKFLYTIAGHAGNGNFHIIPLFDLSRPDTAKLILEISDRVYTLLQQYNGSITAEHNDGIIRTPYLKYMYSEKILKLFQETKDIFDPQHIFNPGKKVSGTTEYLASHLIQEHHIKHGS